MSHHKASLSNGIRMSVAFIAILVTLGITDASASPQGESSGNGEQDCASHDLCTAGVAITGNNNLRGKTVFSFEGVGAVSFGQFVGVWNPGGALPLVIDESTPDDAVLATIAPPGFPLYGENAPNIPFQNLRFQDVPTVMAPDGAIGPVPSVADAGRLTAGFGPEKSDYTLGQWLAVEGELKMSCTADSRTKFQLEAENLVPNGGVYTMWAFWNDNGTLVVRPFGGSGVNTFTTDRNGEAELDLTIPSCALDTVDGVNLVAVQLDYHSDDGVTGTLPNLPLVPGRGPGIIGHSALIFSVRGQSCEEVGDCVVAP